MQSRLISEQARRECKVPSFVVDARLGVVPGAVAVDWGLVAEQLHLVPRVIPLNESINKTNKTSINMEMLCKTRQYVIGEGHSFE